MPGKSKNPFRLFQELRRRKVIRVITVYCAAAFVIIEAAKNIAESFNLTDEISKWIVIVLGVGLVITILLSWIFDITPEGIQKTKPIEEVKEKEMPVSPKSWRIATYVSIVIIIGLIILNIFSGSIQASRLSRLEKSIAVLPLRYLSKDSSQIHFCAGIQEEILNDLFNVNALSVRSRTSTDAYKGSDKNSPVIGEELNANFLIEGSVAIENNKIKLWIQLIIAELDKHLWSNTYQIEELDDIFTVQSEIAMDIVGQLEVVLTTEEINIIDKKPTENIEAYIQYLIGDYKLSQLTENAMEEAIVHYQKAIELDPAFARAYCNLAFAHILRGGWFYKSPTSDYTADVKNNLLKALELDSELGEAYYILGDMYYLREWDWDGAAKNFKKGLDINPNYIWGRIEYANFLTAMGRFDESIKISSRTVELDPRNIVANNELAWPMLLEGDYEKALEVINKSLELDPGHIQTLYFFMVHYTELGEYNKALYYWGKMKEIHDNDIFKYTAGELGDAGYLLGMAGKREEAMRYLNELNRRAVDEEYEQFFPQAWIYIGLGENEKALELLEQGYVNRDLVMIFLNIHTKLDPLRSDERFKAILEKMNFPTTID